MGALKMHDVKMQNMKVQVILTRQGF